MTDEPKRHRTRKPKTRSIGQSDTDSCSTAAPAVSPVSPDAIASCSGSCMRPEVTEEVQETQTLSPLIDESSSSSYEDSQTEEVPLLEPDPSGGNTPSLTYYIPTPQSSLILTHYFSTVCLVNSAFDSSYNPFRSEVSRMMTDSPLLYGCVLSMSAAHFYQGDQSSSCIPLQFQTEALSHLSDKLSEITTVPPARRASGIEADDSATALVAKEKTLKVPDDVLLAIILLGMTAAWHDVTATGLPHLHGSRQLFKSWVSSNDLRDHKKRAGMSQTQAFLVSSMIYWEAMSSVLLDQEYEALSYLDIFCDPNPPSLIHPCPWTGVGTPIFAFLAKTVTLVRNNRALRSLRVFKTGETHRSALYTELLGKATDLEAEILSFRLPFVGLIDDIGDPCTTPGHFLAVSRCYRLAALLELYRAFPETVKTQAVLEHVIDVPAGDRDDQTYLLLGLAFGMLGILETIPSDSGTISTQLLALMIAGSALGPATPSQTQDTTSGRVPLHEEVTRWRSFVRQRIHKVYATVGLRPVGNASLILEEVWSRMDALPSDHGNNTSTTKVNWMDVMSEKRLETIFG
ncbi:Beauvericin cluster-specific repressor bea4 [Fusarium torreyae]|uniref:Beauvericin cluster-specific repressor bea4 n=1 Tax=Fusarium torreyae TaxID=1237075 RepID=A0A9W8S9B3_9HYPO|nr:Beauvericin cluster-specific repressor bea4 [Fusarium torreyae]